ncbi:MAG: SPOR domain-containing protein [Gemmatimonadota bacterium]|nr:SPOR domain-containing protein [Gemmatimonadota bacterium]MDH3426922.1 SPOR domain-containing protein [Gemmatimonadota bacterium]
MSRRHVTRLAVVLLLGGVSSVSAQSPSLDVVEAAADRGDTRAARVELEEWLASNQRTAARGELTRARFLRGRLMSDADSAEVEYLRAAIDGHGPFAALARLRLGQLQLAKGDLRRAAEHLAQLRADDPDGSLVPTSWVWTARVAEAMGDAATGCAAWAAARASLDPADPAYAEVEQSRSRCEEADRQPGEVVTYTVQLGAFGTSEAAVRLRDGAADIGVAVRVEAPSGGVHVFRVRAGRFGTREAADMLAGRFRREGFDAIVVPEEP